MYSLVVTVQLHFLLPTYYMVPGGPTIIISHTNKLSSLGPTDIPSGGDLVNSIPIIINKGNRRELISKRTYVQRYRKIRYVPTYKKRWYRKNKKKVVNGPDVQTLSSLLRNRFNKFIRL